MLRSVGDVHMPKFLAFLHVAPLTSLRSWRGSSRHATVPEVFLPQIKPWLNCVAVFQECELAGMLHRALLPLAWPARIVLGADSRPPSSWRGPPTALKYSCRSDAVTWC